MRACLSSLPLVFSGHSSSAGGSQSMLLESLSNTGVKREDFASARGRGGGKWKSLCLLWLCLGAVGVKGRWLLSRDVLEVQIVSPHRSESGSDKSMISVRRSRGKLSPTVTVIQKKIERYCNIFRELHKQMNPESKQLNNLRHKQTVGFYRRPELSTKQFIWFSVSGKKKANN